MGTSCSSTYRWADAKFVFHSSGAITARSLRWRATELLGGLYRLAMRGCCCAFEEGHLTDETRALDFRKRSFLWSSLLCQYAAKIGSSSGHRFRTSHLVPCVAGSALLGNSLGYHRARNQQVFFLAGKQLAIYPENPSDSRLCFLLPCCSRLISQLDFVLVTHANTAVVNV